MSQREWIEVPAHRILRVPRRELADYTRLDEDGKLIEPCAMAYMIRRESDGKLFRHARFYPANALAEDCVFLEEF